MSFPVKEFLMRYTPVAVALSLVAAMTSSVSLSAPPETLDPRAVALLEKGRAALSAGEVESSVDAFESALTVEPGSVTVLLALADANRRMGLQGKALHYYRVALSSDPRNVEAIAGEGVALAEKGATEKANRNLARLKTLCGAECPQVRSLGMAIAKSSSAPRMVTAEAVTPKPMVSEN